MEVRPGRSRSESQEKAKRSARRPSGVAWVANVATATGRTISRSGQSSRPSRGPATCRETKVKVAAIAAAVLPPRENPTTAAAAAIRIAMVVDPDAIKRFAITAPVA